MSVWAALQILLVFYKEPIVFISDEVLYKRISYSLFQFQPALSWHYPVLYPMLVSIGFFFQEYFYEAMLAVNILFKGACLLIIWRLLKKNTHETRALYALILIAFSPIYFLYSRLLMAENLACPLLIISVLYHEHYRNAAIKLGGAKRLGYTIVAAAMSLALFWTKYLMLVTLPVFCLFWSTAVLNEPIELRKKVLTFLRDAFLYTFFVVSCIGIYAWIYAVRTSQPFSLDIITGTMGFAVGSGPSVNGYAMSAGLNWVASYALYALLGCAPIIAGMISDSERRLWKENRRLFLLCGMLILVLIYVSARHSTHVNYNEGGKMMNLCGRYVAYATPLLAICWMRTCAFSKKHMARPMRMLLGAVIGIAVVWSAYEALYVHSPGVEQSASWLTGIRAADNAGFTNLGILFCWICCIGICITVASNRRIGIGVICILMCVNSFAAIMTCEKYHPKDYAYSAVTKKLVRRHKNDEVAIVCTDSLDKTYLKVQFYENGDSLKGISVWSVPDLNRPLYIQSHEGNYLFALKTAAIEPMLYQTNMDLFEGDFDDALVFLKWDDDNFETVYRETKVSYERDGHIRVSCEGNKNLVFISGTYLFPAAYEAEENQTVSDIEIQYLKTNTISIYDLEHLTVSQVTLEVDQ